MDKKKAKMYIILSLIVLAFSLVMELTDGEIENNSIERPQPGEGEQEIELVVNGEGIEKDYKYNLTLQEQKVSEEKIREVFNQAKKEIDKTVFGDETPDSVTHDLVIKEYYADDKVQADWSFSDTDIVDFEGKINQKALENEERIIEAQVTLQYGEQEEEYRFSFSVHPQKLVGQEKLIHEIDRSIDQQQEKIGENLQLPEQIGNKKIIWSKINQHLTIKIAFFEVIIFILLILSEKEKKKRAIKSRQDQMKLDYSDIVSKLAILLGSGMTTHQAWNIISARYIDERQRKNSEKRYAYEEMVNTYYEMRDGVSERNAYQRFGERSGVSEYHRLSRLLVQNLQKGSRGLCQMLEKESSLAFEERKIIAKKMGEEAGTKLLMPLVVIMTVVIAIVVFPAILDFNV